MGNTCLLFGYINAPNLAVQNNAHALDALPDKDNWPYLTRDIFSAPDIAHSYNEQLITFGLVYKNLFPNTETWRQWQHKFESLLRQLEWYDAYVQMQIDGSETFVYRWEAIFPTEGGETRYGPVQQWSFTSSKA